MFDADENKSGQRSGGRQREKKKRKRKRTPRRKHITIDAKTGGIKNPGASAMVMMVTCWK